MSSRSCIGVQSLLDLTNVDTDIIPISTNTYDLGTSSKYWDNVYINNLFVNNETIQQSVSTKDYVIEMGVDNPTDLLTEALAYTYNSSGVKYSGLGRKPGGTFYLFKDATSITSSTDLTTLTLDTLNLGNINLPATSSRTILHGPDIPSSAVTLFIQGADATTANGGSVSIFAGSNNSASNKAGNIRIFSGSNISGDAGDILIEASGLGSSSNNGKIYLGASIASQVLIGNSSSVNTCKGTYTFDNTITLSNQTAKSILTLDSSKNISSATLTNGQLLIGSTGNSPSAATITGTTSQILVSNGSGTITLSTPQSIATTSNVTFNTLLSGTVSLFGDPTSGEGNYYGFTTNANTTVYYVAGNSTLFSHSFRDMTKKELLNIQASSGTITIPATTNQLVLGTTKTITITCPAPAASKVLTIPDPGADAKFVLTEGSGVTINQIATFGNTTDSSSTTTGSLITSGGLGVAKTAYFGQDVFLATSGGTPSALNYYEIYDAVVSFSGCIPKTTTNMRIVRCGSQVTINFLTWDPAVTTTSTGTLNLDSSNLIPTRFRVWFVMDVLLSVFFNGVYIAVAGTISDDGSITIYRNTLRENFDSGIGLIMRPWGASYCSIFP